MENYNSFFLKWQFIKFFCVENIRTRYLKQLFRS